MTKKGRSGTPKLEPKHRAELLGQPRFFTLSEEGKELEVKLRSRRGVALLAYLHGRERFVSRERLLDLLWPEGGENARASLRVLLARLKQLLPGVLAVTNDSVALRHQGMVWDVDTFGTLRERGTASALAEAAMLYRGEFLQGFDLKVASDIEPWLESERQHWHDHYNALMRQLVDMFVEQGRANKARPYVERWLQLAPNSEAAYRQKLWLSWKEGRTESLYTDYQKLVRRLESEWGVEPEASTQELFERVMAGATEEVPTTLLHSELPNTEISEGELDPLSLYKSNLELTSFIGRKTDVEVLTLALKQYRLVTLHGMGGVGKTRLALEVVRTVQAHYGDHICILTCEAMDDKAFRKRLEALTRQSEILTAPALIVLDSFDMLSIAPVQIVQLLQTSTQITVLVTSREPLGLLGERQLEVKPLPFPEGGETSSAAIAASPAVQLFWERAYFKEVSEGDAQQHLLEAARTARAMCGLPLGLEIAASNIQNTTLSILATEVEKAPHVLEAEHHTVARHESLNRVAQDSWERLEEDHKCQLVQLTRCPEPFTLDIATEHVQMEPRDLKRLQRRGFLHALSQRKFSFPLPFRRFVEDLTTA